VRLQGNKTRLFLLVFPLLALVACGGSRNLKDYSSYVQVLSNADSTVNELSAVSDSEELNEKLNARFQSVSENKMIDWEMPELRLDEKEVLLNQCLENFDSCQYIPEDYAFEIHRNFLNLHYQYNEFGSHDVFHKHALIDLSSGKRVLYLNMFDDPNRVLELYNAKYIEEFESYLTEFSGKSLSEDEQEEYDVIRNHLDSRKPFQLHELNNCELLFDSEKKRFTGLRFHYNGSGGIYKSILTEGSISFSLKELEPLINEGFKRQLGKI